MLHCLLESSIAELLMLAPPIEIQEFPSLDSHQIFLSPSLNFSHILELCTPEHEETAEI